jgi:protein-L-isoaspartate O-methyltransferase
MEKEYVHGYTDRESERLVDQATTLAGMLHHDTAYPPGCRVLEAGCGVGAQTAILAGNSPGARFVSVDLSADSVRAARGSVAGKGFTNVDFLRCDILRLPFREESFDHVFLCFVLEHLADPGGALRRLRGVLKPGGSITVIEGDHGSAYFHPDSELARRTIRCLVDLQAAAGGNALIGRQLHPLLKGAGFDGVSVSPRMVYVDSGRPELVEGFTKNTFIAMVEGVREQAVREGLMSGAEWDLGIRELHRTAEEDGTFVYTFFKGTARK